MPAGIQITMPAFPLSPASVEFALNDTVGQSTSSFDPRLQQFYAWAVGPCELSMVLPPMTRANFLAWKTFLTNLQGQANYFTLTATFAAAYPDVAYNTASPPALRFWRLKTNRRNWQIPKDRYYRLILDCREAF